MHNNGQGGFVNWWKDDEQYEGYSNVRWCSDGTCTNCNDPPYVDDGSMKCFATCTPWGAENTNSCVADLTKMDGNPPDQRIHLGEDPSDLRGQLGGRRGQAAAQLQLHE